MAAKTIFWYCVILLIHANYRENDGVNFFFHVKRSLSDSQLEREQKQKQNKTKRSKRASKSSKMGEKQILGP